MLSEPFFNNRALFSDYYLTSRLPNNPEWQSAEEAGAMTRAFKTLRELYADVRETFSNRPEEVIRARLLEPVLTTLGFTLQAVKTRNTNSIQADYKLYASTTSFDKPLALCLAYTWRRNLDGKDEQRDDKTPEENPGAVVVSLLDSGEADWAIVTNGKIWRLYSAKAHSRATNYYEIDLEETLAQAPVNREYAFRYFWLFFRAAAFIPAEKTVNGEKRQLCFLDSLVSESERYARELGERLKERVFFEIFPHFARGIINYARRTGQLPANLESLADGERDRLLEPFFSVTLTFLYRLLFLFYAESRDLLPVREVRGYYETSLEKLRKQIAEKAGTIEDQAAGRLKSAYNDLSTTFYDRLQELFNAVDKGDTVLNVPVYNGGLFATQPDPEDSSQEADVARFLTTCKIPDRELALGLDLMSRDSDEKRHDLVFIDYKSLGVRQLGSIYEGLLECKLRIAPVEMAVIKGKKTEEVVSYTEAQRKKLSIVKEGRGRDAREKVLAQGTVYLENDRRERKATGSYYTPDYIVKYIVEHTVGPVIVEKLEALRPIFREAEKTLKVEQDKARALGRKDISPENVTYKKFRKTLNDTFFDLKVLDPAMGSGHFLVEAVDYITDQMAKILTAFKWNPIVHELAQTRQEIQKEMERQGVTIDMSKLTDLNLLKRHVLKSCIYGVDLNPIAVELAKVSLWLDCFTLGASLSFLDHHMKCGNSLIGGNVQEVQDALSQDLWGNQFSYLLDATQLMRKVGELSDVTAQEVAASRTAYRGAYDALAPFKRLLDVYISEYFGNKGAKHKTRLYTRAIAANDYSHINHPQDRQAIETALKLAQSKRFFHWELEFPEVFFDETKRKENGGFDAVVGNPPYINMVESSKSFDDYQKPYFRQVFRSASGGFDMYILFQEQALNLICFGRRVGLIIPNKFLSAEYAIESRKWLLSNARLDTLVNFSSIPVFDASVYPIVIICTRRLNPEQYEVEVNEGIEMSLDTKTIACFSSDLLAKSPDLIWSFLVHSSAHIFQQILTVGEPLENVSIVKGAATVSEAYELKANIVQLRDLGRDINFTGDCVPFVVSGTFGRYDNRWLIEPVQYIKDMYIQPLLSLKSKSLSETRKQQIKSHKIIISGMAKRPTCIIDTEGIAAAKSTIIIYHTKLSLLYLASIINSELMAHIYSILFETLSLSGGYLRFGPPQVARLPIRRINFTTPPQERSYYLEKAKNLYEFCLSKNDQACVLGFVDQHLSKDPEESDVVHDLLAFLAEEMSRLNKEKRAVQKDFLDRLERTLRILPDKEGRNGIDVLTGKARLANYPGDYQKGEPSLTFEELLAIMRKNKGRLGVSLSDAGLVERLRNEYEGSLEMVLPLKDRLAKTDALIDQVVYRLYGLTEEEIAVVEGRG